MNLLSKGGDSPELIDANTPQVFLSLISLPPTETSLHQASLHQASMFEASVPEASVPEALLESCEAWLSEQERERIARMSMPAMRERQRLIRLCVRAVLSRVTGIPPTALQFTFGPNGKPALASQPDVAGAKEVDFNISHSGDMLVVACIKPLSAAGKWHFGVDIERLRPKTDIAAIYRHYFSEPEQRLLEEQDADKQRATFFDLWALKESFIKATGRGLAQELKSFGFSFADAAPSPSNLPQKGNLQLNDVQRWRDAKLSLFGKREEAAQWAEFDWQSLLINLDAEYRLALTLGLSGAALVDDVKGAGAPKGAKVQDFRLADIVRITAEDAIDLLKAAR
ncbi:4'-phosphopantetheinyl transferase superfamily protein [Shewanella sp. JM162201]|uniref:4'-phosphopantetheinyl transferase superfamily protein n=1 Tax=Shewanella jiangmenensis TaxID=2837387 RepID=A0ABS5V2R6_9GAMM|nr:4'-phosphopantetheinyl transferase superfamily protein [Shewanella jiangmenensis]MBT1444741.1 4'-phosphopantetheinyl transferase superfamily protein [Shewanella jiangmenensis]